MGMAVVPRGGERRGRRSPPGDGDSAASPPGPDAEARARLGIG